MTVTGAIQPELSYAEQQRARQKPPDSLDAWDIYQRGIWHCWRHKKENVDSAIQHFENAIKLDSEFCLAYAYLAFILWKSVVFRYASLEILDSALQIAERALAIDNSLAEAHWAFGVVSLQRREHELATEALTRSIELNPSFAHAHQWLGWTMVYDKRALEGIQKQFEAQRLSPNDPTDWGKILIRAQANINLKNFVEAEKLARHANRFAANIPLYCTLLASIGYTKNTYDAEHLINEVLNIDPQFSTQTIADVFPFRYQEDIDVWVEGLRMAGVSEN